MLKSPRILIVGNGFGGVYTLRNLAKAFRKGKTAKLAMAGERNYFLFTPLLHEVATGSLSPGNITEPIRQVLGCYLDTFYLGKVTSVNLTDRTVLMHDSSISYDYLVLAPGSTTNFYTTPGAETYSFQLKSIEDAVKIKNHCTLQMERASHESDAEKRKQMLRFVVVGGGPTGVELVAELEELVEESFSRYYPCEILKDVSILLIQKGVELVPQFGENIRRKSLAVLRKKGVEVLLQTTVKEVAPSHILIDDGTRISTETVIWVAGIKSAELTFNETVEKSPDGRLLVNKFLQLPGHPEVFAVGDIAAFKEKNENTFLPALAQVAEKESRIVAENIKLLAEHKPLLEFTYHSFGMLLSLGQWMAAGEIFHFTISGHFAWWLWRTIYLAKFISWRKKIRVAIDWTMNIFSPRDISQL